MDRIEETQRLMKIRDVRKGTRRGRGEIPAVAAALTMTLIKRD